MWGFVFSALAKAANAGLTYAGQRQEGAAYRRQGEQERDLFGKNADLAEKQAVDAEARGVSASNRQTYRMRTMLGAQSASFAGQGVSLTGGSPADVVRNDQSLGEADRLNILENARREAWGYRQQEDIYHQQGDMAYQAGVDRQKASNLESVGTLVNFAGDMFGMYKGMNQ